MEHKEILNKKLINVFEDFDTYREADIQPYIDEVFDLFAEYYKDIIKEKLSEGRTVYVEKSENFDVSD